MEREARIHCRSPPATRRQKPQNYRRHGPWSDVVPLKFGRSWVIPTTLMWATPVRTQEEFQTPTTEMTPMELGQVWGGKPPT
ncbi:hypothetical protein Tsubulata_023873 [Turnera subulata]|uniref:Uncharacterized protein n=1 Tax=Turnera subulata TaxID=218843 RepID=A0A9Q0F7N6_9ROSI|nr:hypothetical protein Tsubulata_023873 [Turnera subulata]